MLAFLAHKPRFHFFVPVFFYPFPFLLDHRNSSSHLFCFFLFFSLEKFGFCKYFENKIFDPSILLHSYVNMGLY